MARNPYRKKRRTYAERQSWQPRGSGGPTWSPVFGWGLLVAGLIAVIAYVLLFSTLFQLRHVQVHGAQAIPADKISEVVREAGETRFGPLVSQSLLVVNSGSLSEELRKEFPDLSQVTVSTKLPNTVSVEVKERQTTLLWKSGDRYHLVDRQGFAFDDAQPRDDLILVEDSTGLPVEEGKQIVSSKFIKALEDIKGVMAQGGPKLKSFRIPESTFEVHAITADGYYAIFDTTRPIANQIDALRRAVATTRPFQYADLRIPGRVYVR